MAKISRAADAPGRAKYVAVTAITPTPAGEGKTVTAVGLAMALCRRGRRAVATLREPSLAPVLGVKGGGAGGGRATLEPFDEINLGLTGDLHAVAAANNLLAAVIDDHLHRERSPRLDSASVQWKRVVDIGDRALAHVTVGLGGSAFGPPRETGFELTAASEVMALLALARDAQDLRARLGTIVVGSAADELRVTAEALGAAGAMAVLLKRALSPNLVQTCEGTAALVHTGPFANIAHGNSSVVADRLASQLADYVVTEGGFGADMGAEKLFHIKCRASGLVPDAAVLVCTVRALKVHSGRFDVRPGKALPAALLERDLDAVRAGADNLRAHLDVLAAFGVPAVVAINVFPSDARAELDLVAELARDAGAFAVAESDVFARGSEGGLALADAVIAAAEAPSGLRMLYELGSSIEDKLTVLATRLYGAASVELAPEARASLARIDALGGGHLPVCVAKTQYSLSHDPKLLGRPTGFVFPVRDLRLSAGAGFVYALAGSIRTLPGLPPNPALRRLDLAPDGTIRGLS